MTFKETYPGAKFNGDGRHVGPGPWLDVIRKANGIVHDETGGDGPFGAPRYENDDYSVEIYDFATVSHDFPCPRGPSIDDLEYGSREWESACRERDRLRDAWLPDPRNTVTITSKTDDGARLLKRAHDAAVGTTCTHCGRRIVLDGDVWVDPDATGDDSVWRETCDAHDTFVADHEPPAPLFEVVGVLSYDPETDTLS